MNMPTKNIHNKQIKETIKPDENFFSGVTLTPLPIYQLDEADFMRITSPQNKISLYKHNIFFIFLGSTPQIASNVIDRYGKEGFKITTFEWLSASICIAAIIVLWAIESFKTNESKDKIKEIKEYFKKAKESISLNKR